MTSYDQFCQQKLQVVLVEEVLLIHFPTKQPQMTYWAYLLDLLGHTKARYECIVQLLLRA
ncbi:hypothetical protein LOK49_Contig619G00002 [Camellia lanceoleosa]|nr:hypothetical protein LOK49_Contig619G00002 [Camellia lanceoleosa]